MKHLAEIYIDIDRQCNESKLSIAVESEMLLKASEEYVESLIKIGGRWESVLRYDLDSLKASEKIRGSQKGFIFGAEMLIRYVAEELKRYGISLSDGCYFDSHPFDEQIVNVPDGGEPETPQQTEGDVTDSVKDKDGNIILHSSDIQHLKDLKTSKEIAEYLVHVPDFLTHGYRKKVWEYLSTNGIIKVGYSDFCKAINGQL